VIVIGVLVATANPVAVKNPPAPPPPPLEAPPPPPPATTKYSTVEGGEGGGRVYPTKDTTPVNEMPCNVNAILLLKCY
jgi:hypothetical protein